MMRLKKQQINDKNGKKFTILTIDGGGIRGMIPAKVLADLEIELKKLNPEKKFHEYFDLICGTSTGAIIATAISLGIPCTDIVKFYRESAKLIFPKWYFKIIPRTPRAVVTSIYSNKALRKKLRDTFAAANGGEPPLLIDAKTRLCIPTFNGNDGQINVLKTKHHKDYVRDFKIPAHEAVLCSASAPVYFPPHSFSFSNKYGEGVNLNMIDGGLFANNPTLIGILEAVEKLGNDFSDIEVISLGTGKGKQTIKTSWKPKGLSYWFIPKSRLTDIILDSQAQITEQYINFLKRIVANQGEYFEYLRVQYDFGGDTIDLNASSANDIQCLEAIGGELSKNYIPNILKILNK